ncbi:MAG: hypothetical protein KGM24_00875, partial [Elusimicrobia bacterium]|nr:hypothetical protein [Elusimicrobiota bacterium]
MTPERLAHLAALELFPGAVLSAYGLGLRGRRLERLAAACAGLATALAALPLAGSGFGSLSLVLTPFAAFLWFLGAVVAPRV